MTTFPADHKQPKDQPQTIMINDVTLTVNPNIFDDLDMVDYMYDLQHASEDGQGDGALSISPMLRKICGAQYAAVKNALRDKETGRIPLERIQEFINSVLTRLAPNSERS